MEFSLRANCFDFAGALKYCIGRLSADRQRESPIALEVMHSKSDSEKRLAGQEVSSELREGALQAERSGGLLFDWWRQEEASGGLKKFSLLAQKSDAVQMDGFFERLVLDGRDVSVMGCVQRFQFQTGWAPERLTERLAAFVLEEYFAKASWPRRDGETGGFRYSPLFGKTRDSRLMVLEGADLSLNRVQREFEWAVFQVDILDFVRSFPIPSWAVRSMSRFIREAAFIQFHSRFAEPALVEPEGALSRHCFGYSFLPAAVHPSIFGFGPGRFGTAVKQFDIAALHDGRVEFRLAFIVTPRSEMVLNVWGFDPVYAFSRLLDLLTFKRLNLDRRIHDRLDAQMLTQHCQVHHSFLEGIAEAFQARYGGAQ
jgi:hypothetical protein